MITLGITVYNNAKMLDTTLASVVKQNFTQIIIVNDGSIDQSAEVLQKYAAINNVTIINQANHGVSNARNIIIDRATTPYLAFLDGDDILAPDYVLTLESLISMQVDAIHFNFIHQFTPTNQQVNRYFYNQSGKGRQLYDQTVRKFRFEMKNMVWTYCFRLAYLREQNLRFDEKIATFEDIDFLQHFYETNPQIMTINKPLVTYVANPESITRSDNTDKMRSAINKLLAKSTTPSQKQAVVYLAAKILPQDQFNQVMNVSEVKANYRKLQRQYTLMKIKRKLLK